MKKSTKYICVISVILLGLAALYLTGAVVLPSLGLEYRFWVDVLGKCLCMLVLPLWLLGLGFWKLWQHFRENIVGKGLIGFFGSGAAVLYLIWCYFGMLIILFDTNEDHNLGGGLLSVVTESFPKPVSYAVYEKVGPLFRRESSLTSKAVADCLAKRYGREFYPLGEEGNTLYVDAGRENVTTEVVFRSGKLCDDYPQKLADYYLAEGARASDLSWKYCPVGENGEEHFCLIYDGEKGYTAFGEDVYRLMVYALEQDSLLRQYEVCLYFSSAEYEGKWGVLGFGLREFGDRRQWEELSEEERRDDIARVTRYIIWDFDDMRLQVMQEEREAQEGAQGNPSDRPPQDSRPDNPDATPTPEPEPSPQLTMREMTEAEYPKQCEAAEAIWEAELKESGYGYEPGVNAKGHLVIYLGRLPSDRLQSATEESDYYLNYDRESKNGNCFLFVLVEVPEGYSSGDAYLREFYACEKGSLQVVAGNKTAWEQVGCEEYREITGE